MSPDPTITIVDSKYKVESVLGGGSFSEVYVVTDPKGAMGRSALKLLRKGLGREASAEVVQDFKHEFAILKDLNHPHIARILDFGYDPRLRQYYYTTELVDGRGLFEATEGRSCEDILEWFVQALRAFNYLHSYQIHHFDVKAANVLLTKQGSIKVIDFGLASIDPGGRMVGTPSYMAPEIIAKEKPDGRADLYSLGVLFYSCFTRRNPFRGKGVPETLKNQQTLVAPPASTLREDLPPFLDSILAKLLEKNPANRYQRAEEALREINFYSPKKFALETRETLLSYLPEEGRLIGRRRETEAFKRLFQGVFDPASAETQAFLLVAGDHGSGKTRLLKEFKYDSQLQGVNVVSASARSPEERTVWLDAFRRHATEGRPTVFLLDDLDAWPETDEGFLQFQAALARLLFQDATEGLPLLWVGSLADPAALPPSFSELWAGRKIETLRLGSFAPEELREYVISLTGLEDPPPALLAGLEARTDGNPLLVTEFLRSLIEEGALFDPAGRWKKTTFEDLGIDFSKARFSGVLEELLYARFGKLPSGLRGILEALSIGGALRASELSRLTVDEELTHGIEELLARDLVIKDTTGRYQVKNMTLAELIEQRLDPERRRDLHDRAAQLFREGSELRIFHEIRGSDLGRAFDLCRSTADHYLQEARGREAASLLDFARTLEIEKTPEQEIELLLKLGEAGLIALDYPRALRALEEAESILSRQKMQMANVHLQVDALLRIGGVYFKMHEIEKSRGSLAAASTLLHYLKGDRVRELVAENLRGAILLEEGKLEEARRLFEGTRERWTSELGSEERSKVTNNDLGLAYLLERRYPEALKQLCADMEFLQGVGDRFVLARTHYHLGQAYAETGEFSAAVEHYELAANLAQALKHTELLLRAYNGLGNAFNVMGRPEDAIRFYDRGLDLCERTGDLHSHAAILVNIGIIRAAQSDFERALRSLDPAVAFLKSLKNRMAIDRQVLVRALLEIGDVALKRKQWKASEGSLREALTLAEEGEGVPSLKFWIYYTLGELFLAKGELEELKKILPDIKKSAQSADEKERATEISMKEKSMSPSDSDERRALPARVKDPYQYILEINKFINAESDLAFVLKSVLNYALELSQAESGAILLLKDPGGLEISASRNLEGNDPLAEISRSVAKRAIESGNPLVLQNAADDPSLGSEASVARLDLKSVICLPIKSKNRAIGALYLDNRLVSGAFEHVDLEALKAFADQAGIAIQNARLLALQEASRRSLEVKVSEISTRLEHYQTLVNLSERSLDTKYDYKNIVARSKPMVEVFRLLDKITDTDLSVFIHGESGTGKELIARALHVNGRRSKKRFVAVNCGAIPANLMESELFGYKAGAFTGASRDKKGLFEEADGGTIFLDEVAEMELGLQAKLLRVVQEGEFYRVGDSQPVRCDVRVVSASNKDIQKMAKDNKFREDLYYRLCQIRIDLPALRDRREDIPRLVDHFIREEAGKTMKISSRLLKAFLEYDWPGNIRELENLVKVAVALSEGGVIDANAIPANYGIAAFLATGRSGKIKAEVGPQTAKTVPAAPKPNTPKIDVDNHFDPSKSWYDYEKLIIAKAYQSNQFNAKETAQMLGIAPATLYKKIRENGLTEHDHTLYSDPFHYQKGQTLKDYLKPVFEAALAHAGHKPYTAIAQLKVSQGYFYNIVKARPGSAPSATKEGGRHLRERGPV